MEKFEQFKYYDKKNNQIIVKEVNKLNEFCDVITVFKSKPYNEILTKEDIEEEYQLYMSNGIIIGCYINGEIAGLNCIYDGAEKKHSIVFNDKDKIAYYSGFAVKPLFRGLGVGKLLIYQTDKYLQNLKLYDYSYARILLEGSMSEGIFKKNDFQDAYYNDKLIVDEVKYKRNDPTVSDTDKRKYMVKTMSKKGHGWYIK